MRGSPLCTPHSSTRLPTTRRASPSSRLRSSRSLCPPCPCWPPPRVPKPGHTSPASASPSEQWVLLYIMILAMPRSPHLSFLFYKVQDVQGSIVPVLCSARPLTVASGSGAGLAQGNLEYAVCPGASGSCLCACVYPGKILHCGGDLEKDCPGTSRGTSRGHEQRDLSNPLYSWSQRVGLGEQKCVPMYMPVRVGARACACLRGLCVCVHTRVSESLGTTAVLRGSGYARCTAQMCISRGIMSGAPMGAQGESGLGKGGTSTRLHLSRCGDTGRRCQDAPHQRGGRGGVLGPDPGPLRRVSMAGPN